MGDNYPPPALRAYLAYALGVAKIVLIVAVVSGQNPFTWFGLQTPGIYSWAVDNKLYACMMIFFLSNAIEGQLISTGAFEISFNDVPVWSKLESGRIPSPQEMFQILDNHMKFSADA